MNETTKTAAFVGAAVAMLLAAVFTSYANRPQPSDDFETIGQPFYADFEGTNQAKSLVVTSIDPDAIKEQKFEIKQVDGLWQIPSHEGYPAEAAERLARTSASLVGLTRDSLVGRRTSDYEKFGVVDPRKDDIVDIESVGQSVTLRDANEDVLVDFIIGDRANEDEGGLAADPNAGESFYYVRRADETNVYRIPLDIELSTKFSDWIEPDLLQVEATDVVQLEMNNYQIEERSSGVFGQVKELLKVQGDDVALNRKSSTDDWELENLNAELEKVNQTAVNAVVGVLDEMAIVDVEKKPTLDGRILLDADLNYSVTPAQAELMSIKSQRELDALSMDQKAEFQALQMGIMELQRDLESKGFSFGQTGRKLELVSAGGEMRAGTSGGLLYTLHVGKAPTNTTAEIDVAGAGDEKTADEKEDDGSPTSESDEEGADSDTANGGDSAEESADGAGDSNRYVLIRVAFDESLLGDPGEKPVAPTKPTKPEGYTEASDSDQSTDRESDAAESEGEDGGDDGEEEDEAPKPDKIERNPAFAKYDQDLAAYEEAQVDYEVAVSTYKSAATERESQIEIGKKKAEILNGRFEKWYYVVSSENLKTLQSSRAELVEPVVATTPAGEAAVEADAAATAMEERPDVSFPVVDTEEKMETAKTEEASAAVEETPADEKQVEEKPVEKPSVEKPAVEKPTAGEPAGNLDEPENPVESTEEKGSTDSITEQPASENAKSEEVEPSAEEPVKAE